MSSLSTMNVKDLPANGSHLIDGNVNKANIRKKVVVFGAVGTGVEVIANVLKELGYKVYDEAEAAKQHTHDLPLWIEAANLKKAGQPSASYDMEKILGKYDAIVGTPAMYFADELLEAYSYAKFIVLTKAPDLVPNFKYLSFATSPILSVIDPGFFGKLSELMGLVDNNLFDLNLSRIRNGVQNKTNLLELGQLDSWKPICDYLGEPIPPIPFTPPSVATATAVFAGRFDEIVRNVGSNVLNLLFLCGITGCAGKAGGWLSRTCFGQVLDPAAHAGLSMSLLVIARMLMTKINKTGEKFDPEAHIMDANDSPPKINKTGENVDPKAHFMDVNDSPPNNHRMYIPPHLRNRSESTSPPRSVPDDSTKTDIDLETPAAAKDSTETNTSSHSPLYKPFDPTVYGYLTRSSSKSSGVSRNSPTRQNNAKNGGHRTPSPKSTSPKSTHSPLYKPFDPSAYGKPTSNASSPASRGTARERSTTPTNPKKRSPPRSDGRASQATSGEWSTTTASSTAASSARQYGHKARNGEWEQKKTGSQGGGKNRYKGPVAKAPRPAQATLPGLWGNYLGVVGDGDLVVREKNLASAALRKGRGVDWKYEETFKKNKKRG